MRVKTTVTEFARGAFLKDREELVSIDAKAFEMLMAKHYFAWEGEYGAKAVVYVNGEKFLAFTGGGLQFHSIARKLLKTGKLEIQFRTTDTDKLDTDYVLMEAELVDGTEDTDADRINRIRNVLERYFESHSDGAPSADFDDSFQATQFVDEIADIVKFW